MYIVDGIDFIIENSLIVFIAHKLCFIKEGGLIRKFDSNFKPAIYPCIVFPQPRPFPEGALSYRWPAVDCIVYYRTGGVRGDNTIVYDFRSIVS